MPSLRTWNAQTIGQEPVTFCRMGIGGQVLQTVLMILLASVLDASAACTLGSGDRDVCAGCAHTTIVLWYKGATGGRLC